MPCDEPRPGAVRSRSIVQPYGIRKSARWPSIVNPGGITPTIARWRPLVVSVDAEHVAAAAEPRLPELVADHDHACRCPRDPRPVV